MFSPAGIDGESTKFTGGTSAFLVGPGEPVGGKSGSVRALPLADAWEDGAEEPVSVGATDLKVPFALLLVASQDSPLCSQVNECSLEKSHAVLLVCGHCSSPLHLLSSSIKALILSISCSSLWNSKDPNPKPQT